MNSFMDIVREYVNVLFDGGWEGGQFLGERRRERRIGDRGRMGRRMGENRPEAG
jgi:hypothetical protein